MKPSTTKEQKLKQKTTKRQIRLSEQIKYENQVKQGTEKHCLKCDYCTPDFYHSLPGEWIGSRYLFGYVCNAPIERNPQLRIKNGYEIAKECAFYSDEIPF
jgi:hypothetical protein